MSPPTVVAPVVARAGFYDLVAWPMRGTWALLVRDPAESAREAEVCLASTPGFAIQQFAARIARCGSWKEVLAVLR